jgi:hypothetical protein
MGTTLSFGIGHNATAKMKFVASNMIPEHRTFHNSRNFRLTIQVVWQEVGSF